MKRIFLAIILTISPFTTSCYSQLTTDKNLYKENNSNTWAISFGASNFIMHGDLRSIGTGNLGNFWNFGAYAYVDKMLNPILGLEFKINYSKISGGAQYFSDVYKILYLDKTRITNNLFFKGIAYGAELNLILSFSNLYTAKARKWNISGYFGAGYHQYNSALYEKLPNGTNNKLIDFGKNPSRNSVNQASSIYISTQLGFKYKINRRIDLEFRPSWYFNYEDHLDATISNKQDWETFFVTHVGFVVKLGKEKVFAIWENQKKEPFEKFKIIDTDEDGVMDQLDIEPKTPKGVKVYGNGLAVDADADGLPDYKDDCPLIPGSIKNKGCPNKKEPKKDRVKIIKSIRNISTNIYFDTGKYLITIDSKIVLDKIAKLIMETEMGFRIEGHTDNRDDKIFNLNLSTQRANAVRNYLIYKGINHKRLTSKGYGESNPKYSNTTSMGRQLNRRVEIIPLTSVDKKNK